MTSCRRLPILALLSLLLLAQGGLAEEQPVEPQPPSIIHAPAEEFDAPTTTPEPNAALLAGLGGLALLFFALRRK